MECMPSTRASGDCRCTTRGGHCPEVGYPDGMSAPPERKISETILDFGEPLLSQLDAALPLDMIQSTFQIVITVWNAHVMAMPRWGQPRFLADLHERMRDPQMPPEMVEAFRTLSQRRLERFANDGRAVGDVRRTSTTPVDNWSHRSHGYVEDLVFACKSLICGAGWQDSNPRPLGS